jgi:hypothetical protein
MTVHRTPHLGHSAKGKYGEMVRKKFQSLPVIQNIKPYIADISPHSTRQSNRKCKEIYLFIEAITHELDSTKSLIFYF